MRVFLVTHGVLDAVILIDQGPAANEEWRDDSHHDAETEDQILEAGPHPSGKILVGTPEKSKGDANSSESGRDADQINKSQEAVQHQEGTEKADSDAQRRSRKSFDRTAAQVQMP